MQNGGRPRDSALDALRGIAILSVVLGHVLSHTGITDPPGWIATTIFVLYIFNVQVFGFVSGYLLKRLSLANKAMTLLIPLLASIVLNAAVGEGQFLKNLPGQLVAAVNGSGMWFLWSLFLGFCLFALLRKQWALVIVAVVIGATWQLLPTWTAEGPFRPADALGLVRTMGLLLPYMVLGAVWRRYESRGLRLTPTGRSRRSSGLLPWSLVSCGFSVEQYGRRRWLKPALSWSVTACFRWSARRSPVSAFSACLVCCGGRP